MKQEKKTKTNSCILLKTNVSCECYLRNPHSMTVIWGAALRPPPSALRPVGSAVSLLHSNLFVMFQQFLLPVNTSPRCSLPTRSGVLVTNPPTCKWFGLQKPFAATQTGRKTKTIWTNNSDKTWKVHSDSSIFKRQKYHIFCTRWLNSVISIHSCVSILIISQCKQNTFV